MSQFLTLSTFFLNLSQLCSFLHIPWSIYIISVRKWFTHYRKDAETFWCREDILRSYHKHTNWFRQSNPHSEQHSNSGDGRSPATSSWQRDPRPAPHRTPWHHSSSSGSCLPAGSPDLPGREAFGREPGRPALGKGDAWVNVMYDHGGGITVYNKG